MEAEAGKTDALEHPLGEFLDQLADRSTAAGGGSAAGVCAGMAAGLVVCVARASAEEWDGAGAAVAQAEQLRARAAPLIDLNARAYDDAVRALSGTGEVAPEDRDGRLEETLGRAAEVPLAIGEVAADVAELAALVSGNGAQGRRADACTAAILAEAAAQSAEQLVAVNLTMAKDDARLDTAHSHLRRARSARKEATDGPRA